MTATRVAWLVVGCGFVAAWMTAATTTRQGETPPPTVATARPALVPSPVALNLASEVSRLRGRLGSAPVPRGDGRNPFALGTASPVATPTPDPIGTPALESTPLAVLTPTRLDVTLVGIAEDDPGADGGAVRTAILSVAGTVVLAMEGDALEGGHVVTRIGKTVVDLREAGTGRLQQLFQP